MSRCHTPKLALAAILSLSSVSCQQNVPNGPVTEGSPRKGVAETEPIDDSRIVAGQTIYVPAYSHVLTANDARAFDLAVTLTIRNTDQAHAIVVTKVSYHDRDGRFVRDYVKKPLKVSPLGSVEFFLKEKDTSGGSSACFLVDWVSDQAVNSPISEAVMIGTASTQGISFTCPGRVITERTR